MTADPGTFEEWDKEMEFENPLDFPDMKRKIAAAREKTGLSEAIVTGVCEINGQKAVLGVCDAGFIMSSMGHAVGEKIARAVERATAEELPVFYSLFWWSQNAGRTRVLNADGENFCSIKTPS